MKPKEWDHAIDVSLLYSPAPLYHSDNFDNIQILHANKQRVYVSIREQTNFQEKKNETKFKNKTKKKDCKNNTIEGCKWKKIGMQIKKIIAIEFVRFFSFN